MCASIQSAVTNRISGRRSPGRRAILLAVALSLIAAGAGAAAPMPAQAVTTYHVDGTVLTYGGAPVTGARVYWGWFSPSLFRTIWNAGSSQATGSTGKVAFDGVTAHPGSDALFAYYNPPTTGLWLLEPWELDFSTQNSFVLQPGQVTVKISHLPKSIKSVDVKVGGTAGEASTKMVVKAGAGAAGVLPPGFNDIVVWSSSRSVKGQFTAGPILAQYEWLSPADVQVNVGPGVTAASSVTLDWNHPLRALLAGPACRHSGAPGSVATMSVLGWPAGAHASFFGYSLSGAGSAINSYSAQVASTGPGHTYSVRLMVPKKATIGEIYSVNAWRSDDSFSQVEMYDYYQVCTFGPSARSVASGARIRLSGHVPGIGYVTVFARHSAAGQPATLAAKGWTVVGRYLLKNGRFITPRIRLTRSTWFVARYPGQKGEYFSAFTSVAKVAVH